MRCRVRHQGGARIKSAWDNEPVAVEQEMHAPKYDYSALDPHDNAYLRAVAAHLSWRPGRFGRRREEDRGLRWSVSDTTAIGVDLSVGQLAVMQPRSRSYSEPMRDA